MTIKFKQLTRRRQRQLAGGEVLREHGIHFERLFNGDGRYTINVMVDGRRIHRVVGKESEGVTRHQAEQVIAQLRTDVRQDRFHLPKGRKQAWGFKSAAEQYLVRQKAEGGKNIRGKTYHLQLHWMPFFGDRPLDVIETADIERYKSQRQQQNVTLSTINRELATLSHLFNQAMEWKWLDKLPAKIKRFKETPSRLVYLTTEQIQRLQAAAAADVNAQIGLFIAVALDTSMRLMEILSIRLAHIDGKRQMIYLPKAKAGAREQPMTRRLAVLLQEQVEQATPDQVWLFPSSTSTPGHTVNIRKPFERVVKEAELDPKQVTCHTLRHTAITHLVQSGVDLPTVKRISGHKTLRMVERYSHQNGEHIQTAMDKLVEKYEAS